MIRSGEWTRPTASLAPGYVQASLAVLPANLADAFEVFCRLNPKALPILARTEPGSPVPENLAPTADLRTDLPRYRLYRDGKLIEEATDIVTLWHNDSVAFLIGGSFTFDSLLQEAGIPVRHLELGSNVPMYETNRMTKPAGSFSGPLVVSMRPIRRDDADRVAELTRRPPLAHGKPFHAGSPEELGIPDIDTPDYGEALPIQPDEIPVFWPCGVTALAVAVHSKIPRMITHAPGHMFITDCRQDELIR